MAIKKTTKDIVGSSIILGVGGTALGAMGQGGIATQTIGKASTGMGAVIPAAYGMEVLSMLKPKKRRRR